MSSNTCMIVLMPMMETVARRRDAVDEIEAKIASAAGALNVAHGRLVELAADLIESELWRGYGIKSVEHWLCWKAGLSPERARQITAVARRRSELPVTVATLTAGELSVDQVICVAKHAPAPNDAEVASFAKVATVTQLRSTLSRYSFANQTDPGAIDPTQQAETPSAAAADAAAKGVVGMFHDGHRFGMRVDAPADDGALIEQAMKEAKDALFQTGQPQVTWMDALVEVCNRSLSAVTSTSRRAKYRIYIPTRAAAGSTKAPPCHRRCSPRSAVTASSNPCGRPTVSRSTSAGPNASSPTGPGGSSSTATAPASSPAATPPTTSRSTTSSGGREADAPTQPTSPPSARSTTTASTAASSPSPATPTTPPPCCSPTPSAASWPRPFPLHHPSPSTRHNRRRRPLTRATDTHPANAYSHAGSASPQHRPLPAAPARNPTPHPPERSCTILRLATTGGSDRRPGSDTTVELDPPWTHAVCRAAFPPLVPRSTWQPSNVGASTRAAALRAGHASRSPLRDHPRRRHPRGTP